MFNVYAEASLLRDVIWKLPENARPIWKLSDNVLEFMCVEVNFNWKFANKIVLTYIVSQKISFESFSEIRTHWELVSSKIHIEKKVLVLNKIFVLVKCKWREIKTILEFLIINLLLFIDLKNNSI